MLSYLFSDPASLLELCIKKVNETGAVITNTVCDNPTVKISIFSALGAKIVGDNPQPSLQVVNSIGENILSFLDPPHLIKLTSLSHPYTL